MLSQIWDTEGTQKATRERLLFEQQHETEASFKK